jgi:hypothetical protein
VASAAHTITDEQIQNLSALVLSDAEILDLTLAAALFSALAIVEPLSAAVAPMPIAERWLTAPETPDRADQSTLASAGLL